MSRPGRVGRPGRRGRHVWAGPGRRCWSVNVAKARWGSPTPLVAINHRGAHLRQLADRCRRQGAAPDEPAFPLLCLVVSGGTHPAGADGRPRPIPALTDRRRCAARLRQGGRLLGLPYRAARRQRWPRRGTSAATRFPGRGPQDGTLSTSGPKTAVLRGGGLPGTCDRSVDGLAARVPRKRLSTRRHEDRCRR
jgi:hypothetical protein